MELWKGSAVTGSHEKGSPLILSIPAWFIGARTCIRVKQACVNMIDDVMLCKRSIKVTNCSQVATDFT